MPTAGWTITPEQVQLVFAATRGGVIDDGAGLGAIFRTNDGTNSPDADVSTYDKRKTAFSMLLNRGVIRVGMPMPASADFELVAVDDPYDHASAADLSLFRRPLPATNLAFLSAVMWDGRETFAGQSIHFDLSDQATGATPGPRAGRPADRRAARVDRRLRELAVHGADPRQQGRRTSTRRRATAARTTSRTSRSTSASTICSATARPARAFNPNAFDALHRVEQLARQRTAPRSRVARRCSTPATSRSRASAASTTSPAFGSPAHLDGTCTTCHDSPNAGSHSVSAPLEHRHRRRVAPHSRTGALHVPQQRDGRDGVGHRSGPRAASPASGRTSASSRARCCAASPRARRTSTTARGDDLAAVVDFYNTRFSMHLSSGEKSDLVAFLRTL